MGARQDKLDQRSFGERWLPHPLLTVVLVLLWMLLLNSFSFGGLLVGVVLALVITRLTSNFWPRAPAGEVLVARPSPTSAWWPGTWWSPTCRSRG